MWASLLLLSLCGFLGDCPALLVWSFLSQGQGLLLTLFSPQTNPPSNKQVESALCLPTAVAGLILEDFTQWCFYNFFFIPGMNFIKESKRPWATVAQENLIAWLLQIIQFSLTSVTDHMGFIFHTSLTLTSLREASGEIIIFVLLPPNSKREA